MRWTATIVGKRVELAYKAVVQGEGQTNESAVEIVEKSYADEVFDEFVIPSVVTKKRSACGKPWKTATV